MPPKELEEAAHEATQAMQRLRDVAQRYVEAANDWLAGVAEDPAPEKPPDKTRIVRIGNKATLKILEAAQRPLTSHEIYEAAQTIEPYPFSRELKTGCTQDQSNLAHIRKSLTYHSREVKGKQLQLTLRILNGRIGLKHWPDSMWADLPEVPQEELSWLARSEKDSE